VISRTGQVGSRLVEAWGLQANHSVLGRGKRHEIVCQARTADNEGGRLDKRAERGAGLLSTRRLTELSTTVEKSSKISFV